MRLTAIIGCLGIVLTGAFLTGCAMNLYPGGPTVGGGIATNVRSTAQMLAVPIDPNAKCEKEGKSTAGSFLGLFAFGDSSVNTAMKEAGITKINSVDHEVSSAFLGLWSSDTIIVCGE